MGELKPTNQELEARLAEAEGAIEALRSQQIDAVPDQQQDALLQCNETREALRASLEELVIRSRVANILLTAADDEMYAQVLEIILETLESEYGYFGYIDEEGNLVCPSMTRTVWKECQVKEKSIVFPPETWGGIWGQSLIEKKTVCANRPLSPPKGHLPLHRALVVPIVYQEELLGQFAVANKASDYDENDISLTETVACYVAPVLHARLKNERLAREREEAEAALRASESRLQYLVSTSSAVIYTCEPSSGYAATFVSDNVTFQLGYDARQFTEDAEFWANGIHPEDAPRVFAGLPGLLEKDEFIHEYRFRHKDGNYRWMLDRVRVQRDEDGKPRELIGSMVDITERKQAEKELAEANQLLEAVLKHTHMMAVYLDARFNFVWVNSAYAATCKHEPSFFPGKNYFDLYPHEEDQAIFQRVVDTGEPFYVSAKPFEFPGQPQRGTTYWDWSLIPVKDQAGTVTGLVFTLAEVTERIRAQEEIARLAKFPSENPNPVLRVSEDGTILYGNRASSPFPDAWQCRESGLLADRWHRFVLDALSSGEDRQAEAEFGGRVFSLTFAPVVDSNYVNVYGLDITTRKSAEEALRTERDNLQAIFQAMEDGVYIVNRQYDIQYVNDALVRDFGPYEDRKCYDYFHDRKEVCPWCKNADVFAGKTVHWEWCSPKNGKTYDLMDTPLTLPDGSVGKLEIFRDITDHKRTEQALRKAHDELERRVEERTADLVKANEELRRETEERRKAEEALAEENSIRKTLIEALPYPSMLIRRDRTVIFANRVAQEVGAVVGGQCWEDFGKSDYISDEDKAYISQHKKKPPCGTHCTFCLADDALDDSKAAIAPEVHAFGRIWETYWIPVSEDVYLHFALDITEGRRAQLALEQSERKYRRLVEGSPAIVYVFSTKRGGSFYSSRVQTVLGYTPDYLLDHPFLWNRSIHPGDLPAVDKAIRRATRGRTFDIQYRIKTAHGKWIWLHDRSIEIVQKEGEAIIEGLALDITLRREAEQRLEELRTEVTHAGRLSTMGEMAQGSLTN